MHIFSKILFVSAISIAAVAAFFSVTGIGYLFSGSFKSVIAMAVALEIGKLVSVSFLYRYWKQTKFLLKTYMIVGVFVLAGITSGGIYGYLSRAYAKVAAGPEQTLAEISSLETKRATLDSSTQRLLVRARGIEDRRDRQEQRIDNAYQDSASGARLVREQERLVRASNTELASANSEIEKRQAQIDSLNSIILTQKNSISANTELGPFIYISNSLGLPLDTVVKWFILIIVLVFDPMSISLFLAYNIAVTNRKKPEPIGESPKPDNWVPFETDGPPRTEKVPQEKVRNDAPVPPEEAIQSVPTESTIKDIPYYMQPDFNWSKEIGWKSDPSAVEYRRHNH